MLVFGIGWIATVLMIAVLGGRVLIEIQNPITNKRDIIVNLKLRRENK